MSNNGYEEIKSLEELYELRTNKLSRLRKALAIETSETEKFKLENQIEEEKKEIEKLKTEIKQIEKEHNIKSKINIKEKNNKEAPMIAPPPKENSAINDDKSDTKKSYKMPVIIGVSFMALIIFLIVVIPCPTSSQYFFFRIAFAIAVAGFASVIPGSIEFKYKNFVTASSAMAVFAIIFFLNPAPALIDTSDKCNQPFNLTVFVHGSQGKYDTVLQGKGEVVIDLGNDRKREAINQDGEAEFKSIPAAFKNERVNISVNSDIYKAKYPDSLYTLDDNKVYVQVQKYGLDKIMGSVIDEDGNLLQEVKVMIQDIVDTSDANGNFKLIIPPEKQKEEQTLRATKEGYELWNNPVYPQTKKEVGIMLIKKKLSN
jgi:hypothetical protein